jgi:hypothetical protein
MYEIAVMNPRRAKRRAKKRRSNPTVKLKRNSKGRFMKRSSNPKRRRKTHRAKHRASNPRRKHRRSRARRSNPRRVRRYHRKHRASNPRRAHRRKHRRSNPRFSLGGIQTSAVGLLKEGAIGGAGALLNSVIMGFGLPYLPTSLTSGYALDAVRIVSATALALAGKRFGGRMGEEAGKGAIAVSMYLLFRDIAVSLAPTLPLGDYEEISIDSTSDQIGAYMDPATRLGMYLPDGSKARQGTGMYMNGMGMYMNGDPAMFGNDGQGWALDGMDY